jgi:hypothetical protein
LSIDVNSMTPKQLEAHVKKELELRAEIEEIQKRLEERDYRTGTEKLYLDKLYQDKFRELNIHLGYEDE